MRRWRPAPSAGSLVGILALLLALGGIAWVVSRGLPAASDLATAVALWCAVALLGVAALILLVLLWGYLTLGYAINDRDGGVLILRWAWVRVRIPLDEIEYLGPARQIIGQAPPRRLWPWPGYYLSTLRDESLGQIRLFATLPPRRQLLVCSARGCFGISPDRPGQMLERYRELREGGEFLALPVDPVQSLREAPRPQGALPGLAPRLATAVAPLPTDEDEEELVFPNLARTGQRAFRERTAGVGISLLRDRSSVGLILAGGALVAAMLWFILVRFDSVPQSLPLHYNATGQPDRIGAPREIFILPLITALVALANIALAWSVVRFDRFAARLLLSATCLVQAVAWVALLKLF